MRAREFLTEAKEARTPHPEDSIFAGAQAAKSMTDALHWVIDNPKSLTIKWDGIPALIFGYNERGEFVVCDKYMFDKPEVRVQSTSPKFWLEYDQSRGKNRGELYNKINNIWNGLKAAVGSSSGYFWGDLLWGAPLEAQNGQFVFKPNTVQYAVPVDSQLGKLINGKVGGVVVHQYYPSADAKPVQWNGKGLKSSNVAIITPSMGIEFKLKAPKKELAAMDAAMAKSADVDKFLTGLSGVARDALKTYMNKRITGQTKDELGVWLQANVSGKQYALLVGDGSGYLSQNKQALQHLFDIWYAISAVKNNLAAQLEQQVQGLEQSVAGQAGGEGFVFNTPNGLVKLVNRGGFSAANFSK